jgi:inhibitor of KinA
MRVLPLGDQAALAYCDDEAHATALTNHVRRTQPAWCVDVVQAYVSVAVYYDFAAIEFTQIADWLAQIERSHTTPPVKGRLHTIPCCYEFGLDFERIREHTGLTREAIIAAHAGAVFTVYAIGFCPGFPYLGYLPAELANVPRLDTPRLKVEEGSIGLTGRQTGIYTEARPGGWNLVGKTPLQLVDVATEYFPLRTGDRVRFRPISEREFRKLKGERLAPV